MVGGPRPKTLKVYRRMGVLEDEAVPLGVTATDRDETGSSTWAVAPECVHAWDACSSEYGFGPWITVPSPLWV